MANKLRNLRIEEGSFVDKGANQEAKVVFFKRDLENLNKGGENMAKENIDKAGKTISSKTADSMKAIMDKMKAAIDSMKSMMGMSAEDDMKDMEKGGHMSISEEVRESLPEEVKKHLEDLESDKDAQVKKVEDLEAKVEELSKEEVKEDNKEDVLKSMPEEIRKRVEEAEEKAAQAEEVAKAEKELRITKQYEDEAKELDKMGETEEVAKMLRSADEVSEEHGKKIRETLKSAQAQINLTKVIGKPGDDSGSDAEGKLDAMAEELVKKSDGKLSKEQAHAKVMDTKEGKELYSQHKNERGEK